MDNLEYLLSAYFHQDWNHTYDSWQAVVDDYVAVGRDATRAVPTEIDRLLLQTPDDSELANVLTSLGCAYDPPEGDRQWLAAVGERIRDDLNRIGHPARAD